MILLKDIPLTLAEQWFHSQIAITQRWTGLSTGLRFANFCFLHSFPRGNDAFYSWPFIHKPQKKVQKYYTILVVLMHKLWVPHLTPFIQSSWTDFTNIDSARTSSYLLGFQSFLGCLAHGYKVTWIVNWSVSKRQ